MISKPFRWSIPCWLVQVIFTVGAATAITKASGSAGVTTLVIDTKDLEFNDNPIRLASHVFATPQQFVSALARSSNEQRVEENGEKEEGMTRLLTVLHSRPENAVVQEQDPATDRIQERRLQTMEEICSAIHSLDFLFLDRSYCTCSSNNGGGDVMEVTMTCPLCVGIPALNADLEYDSIYERRYFYYGPLLEDDDSTTTIGSLYANDQGTNRFVFRGPDRPLDSYAVTFTSSRVTGIRETCDIQINTNSGSSYTCDCSTAICALFRLTFPGTECSEEIDTPIDSSCLDRNEIRPLQTPDGEPIRFNDCICQQQLSSGSPEDCESIATISPSPVLSPFSFPPQTSFPTRGSPPVIPVVEGFESVPCTSNDDCDPFICYQGFCRFSRISAGEPCEMDPLYMEPDDFDCETFACGRASGAPDSPIICCEDYVFIFDEVTFDGQYYCSNLGGGQVCLQNDMCASDVCSNGICTGPATPTPPPVNAPSRTTMPAEITTSIPTLIPDESTETQLPTVGSLIPTVSPQVTQTAAPVTAVPSSMTIIENTTEPTIHPDNLTAVPTTNTDEPSLSPMNATFEPTTAAGNITTMPTATPRVLSTAEMAEFTVSYAFANETNVTVDEIISGIEAYLSKEMNDTYPETFVRLELEEVPDEIPDEVTIRSRELQASAYSLKLEGTVYFSSTEPPPDVITSQSAALSNPKAMGEYLSSTLFDGESPNSFIQVDSVVIAVDTASPTAVPLTGSPTATENTTMPTSMPIAVSSPSAASNPASNINILVLVWLVVLALVVKGI